MSKPLLAILLLLSACGGLQPLPAQTAPASPTSSASPSSPAASSAPTSSSSHDAKKDTQMVHIATLHEGESITLPESPDALCARSPAVCDPALNQGAYKPPRAGFFSFRGADEPILRTNREAFHDKTWAVAQSVWLAAEVYDVELTHQGLAHHKCVEAQVESGQHPSRRELYLGDVLPEYAAGTAFNYLVMRFAGKPIMLLFPTWGSILHFRAGSQWLMDCW